MSDSENNSKRPPGTPWPKGQSGNPAGKPKGTKNRATVIQQELTEKLLESPKLQGRARNILNKGLEMAEEGDKQMIKFFLNKWLTDTSMVWGGKEEDSGGSQPAITINVQSKDDGSVTIDGSSGKPEDD